MQKAKAEYIYNRLKILMLSACLLTVQLICKGQTKLLADTTLHFSFNHLDEKDGLHAEFIVFILKDSRGYLWLCSNPGLYRYDGKVFKHYSFSFSDSSTISTNRATHILEDKEGYLWVSTDDGLNRYDYRTDKFLRFQHNPNASTSLPTSQVNRTILDSNGRIWAATPVGLSLFNEKTQSFINWSIGSSSSTTPWVWDLIQDKTDKDILWTVGDAGLYQFRISSQTFTHFQPPDNLIQQKNKIANRAPTSLDRIYEDDEGNLWMGNRYAKLFKFEKQSRQWKSFLLEQSERGGTATIFSYDRDHLWCSGYYPGIKIFNKRTERVTSLAHDPQNPSSPPSQVFHMYRDNEGIIWFTTNYQISKLDPYLNYFKYNLLDIEDAILTAAETTHDIFMAMNNVGVIYRMNKANGIFTKIIIPKQFKLNGRITASQIIFNQHTGDLWLATTSGILVIHPQTGKTRQFEEMYSVTFSNKLKQVSALLQDENSDVWIGLYYGGLYKYLIKENKLIDFTNIIQSESNSPKQLRINDLMKDKNGTIWAATNSGLKLLDKMNNLMLVNDYIQNAKLLNSLILCMTKDMRGNIWLGIKGIGLVEILIQESKAKIGRSFGRMDGMSDDMIESFIFDSYDNLWAISHNGLIQINLKTNIIKNYNQLDGLMSNNMNNYSLLSSTNGMTYIFKQGGFFTFNSSLFPKKNIPPPVYINSLSVLRRDSINTIYPGTIKSLTLKHDENYISFSFSALNFSKPKENKYQYQLGGLQKYWVKRNSDQNYATYTNLDPGTYIFQVKGANQDNVWNDHGSSFQITILPPPWKTWWAYTFYIVLIALVVYFFWRRWVTRVQLKTLATIKSAEALQWRKMDTLKSNFFANISHEFRTPLTLLLGPIEKRSALASDPSDKTELNMMHRNASRLLTLVNQLLDLSRAEAGTLKLRCRYLDLQSSIQQVMSQFSSMADSKAITFEVFADQPVMLFFDSDKLIKIITNLLSNAFKFTPTRGRITVTITQSGSTENFEEGYAKIVIADTGTGIEAEHLTKIFDRFYQVDMSSTRAYEGSGIGLSLTKELVELHHGSVSVTSTMGQGSVFTVKLPLGDRHLKPEEIESGHVDLSMPKANRRVPLDEVQETPVENSILALPSILLVEDNADLRHYLGVNLKQQFHILEADDGEKGILMAIQEVPDIIISDLMMPKKNGLQLCQQLKEDEKTSHIPIILLTAKADIETKLQGYREGADDYISKPFQMEEVLVRIENLLTNRKRIQEKFARHLALSPTEVPVSSVDERFIKKSLETVERFMSDSSFGVTLFAQEMGISHTQLSRKLHALTGLNPNEFIRHLRLLRAADLMRQNAGNVAEITYLVGFNNLSYFSKVFKEKFGVTPLEYLKNPPKLPN